MADVSVRPARPSDVAEIARLQLATWRAAYASILPAGVLDQLSPRDMAVHWSSAVSSPPSPRHRVIVAQEQSWTVGFAALGPAEDPDVDPSTTGEVTTLIVEPRWGRRGHGSRLLAATVDLFRAAGYTTAITWVLDRDTVSEAFYRSAGWERDGAGRSLDIGGRLVDEVRLHTQLEDGPDPAGQPSAG